MRRDLAALLVLFTPSFALADSGRDALDNTVSKALYATVPPGEKPADGTAAPKPGELVHNPPYAHWSQFKVGASVTVKEVVTQPDGSVGELSITSKLLSKSKEKVKVETTVIAGGAKSASAAFQTTKSVEVFPAMIRYEDSQSPTASGYSVTEGKEVIDDQWGRNHRRKALDLQGRPGGHRQADLHQDSRNAGGADVDGPRRVPCEVGAEEGALSSARHA
jgi:hypothetical protein